MRYLFSVPVFFMLWASLVWAETPTPRYGKLHDATAQTSSGIPFPVAGYGSVGVVVSGTFTGTLTFKASVNDNLSNASTVTCTPPNSTTGVTSTTGTGTWICPVSGMSYFWGDYSHSSGSITVSVLAAQAMRSSGGVGSGSMATDALWDAAGDLAVGTGANTAGRLAIGSEGTALIVSGGAVAWGTPAGSGMTHPQTMARTSIGF